jgi:tetrapyrrole methylase family protein/MazG family protein
VSAENHQQEFDRLKSIIDTLRGPEGCPWDKKQTHQSLKPYLIEESYEVLESLDNGNPEKLCEELGDLLLQIMLHARIADENDQFTITDVLRSISDKLVHRHPHVFGNKSVNNADEVAQKWESLKQQERDEGESLLSSVPANIPALAYSQLIQRKAAGVGFDWKQTEDILDKVTEEVTELTEATNDRERELEYGDVLFVLVNLARWLDIDAETALRNANKRFFKRFACMEDLCRNKGITFSELSFNEQNALWDEAKKIVG